MVKPSWALPTLRRFRHTGVRRAIRVCTIDLLVAIVVHTVVTDFAAAGGASGAATTSPCTARQSGAPAATRIAGRLVEGESGAARDQDHRAHDGPTPNECHQRKATTIRRQRSPNLESKRPR